LQVYCTHTFQLWGMEKNITCPKCQHTLDVEQVIKDQLEKQFNVDFLKRKMDLEKDFQNREKDFQQKEAALAQEKERQDRIISEKLKDAAASQREALKAEIVRENALVLDELKKENEAKKLELQNMQKRELELLKQQRQLDEEKQALELRVQRTLADERKIIEEKAREKEREANFLKSQESENLIKDLRQQLDNMQRKVEQGSMQAQGEVLEVELEKLLSQTFPFDEITEVNKGAQGADILHRVRNLQMVDCGTIVFETKRTKGFSQSWIDKLKADTRSHRGEIPVLVTEVLPKEMKQFGLKDGVWVCTFLEAIALVTVLRHNLLCLQDQKVAGENKGEKQQMLYNYLTSTEFAQQIEFVLSGYRAMQETLDKERKAMMKNWKVRQKQIDMMTQSTIDIYGSVKGIAGSSVKEIHELSLENMLLEEANDD